MTLKPKKYRQKWRENLGEIERVQRKRQKGRVKEDYLTALSIFFFPNLTIIRE